MALEQLIDNRGTAKSVQIHFLSKPSAETYVMLALHYAWKAKQQRDYDEQHSELSASPAAPSPTPNETP